MNLGTMKTALKRYAGVDSSDPLTDWINASLHEFEEAYDWPFLQDISLQFTTANTDNLVIAATDMFRIITARVVGQVNALRYYPRIKFEEEIGDPTAKGLPQIYTLLRPDYMVLWPIPDLSNYQVRIIYEKFVPDLAGDGDVPAIPSRYHYTIVEGAAVRALQAESEEERAQGARGIFEDSIDRHITKIGGSKQSGSFNTVRDAQGYGT